MAKVHLGGLIDADLASRLNDKAKAERRTKVDIIESALADYLDGFSPSQLRKSIREMTEHQQRTDHQISGQLGIISKFIIDAYKADHQAKVDNLTKR